MTGSTDQTQIDLKEQLARIQRMIDESDKFRAEQRKLIAEGEKLSAEERKLYAEGLKINRDRWLAPVMVIIAAIGAVTATIISTITLLKIP